MVGFDLLISKMGLNFHIISVPSHYCDTKNWQCFELLSRITATVFSPHLLLSDVDYLELCIEKFLQLFSELYSGSFPNKFHHLIHIPSLIIKNGPFGM